MATLNTFDVRRVQRAVKAGYDRKQSFRDVRAWAMREYGGAWYGNLPNLVDRPNTDKRPINLIEQYVEAFITSIVGEHLVFEVKPRRTGLRGEAKIRELMLNHRAEEIGLLDTYRHVVLDALFGGLGIFVTGTGESTDVIRFRGETFDPGEFCVDRVDLDDYASDPVSRDYRQDTFRAHRLRTTKETLHEVFADAPGEFHDRIDNLHTTVMGSLEQKGETHEIMGPENSGEERIFDEVELWSVCIFQGKRVFRGMLEGMESGGDQWFMPPEEYMGLEGGPYVLMSMKDMPNNNHPVPPIAKVIDLHIAMARTGVKAVNQILRSGRAIFYTPTEEETMAQLRDGPDDDFIKTNSPDKINSQEVGGISAGVAKGFEWLKTEANNATNNIQQARGVSGDANTATEASYLQGAMTRIQGHNRARARAALKQVAKHMAWDLDTNLLLNQTFNVRVPGGGTIDVVYDGSTLEGNFTEFTWDVCPYDEPKGDRNTEMARFVQLLQFLPPAVASVLQTGGDHRALIRIAGQKFGEPDLDEIYPDESTALVAQAQMMQGQPGQVVGQKPTPGQRVAGGGQATGAKTPIGQVRSDMMTGAAH